MPLVQSLQGVLPILIFEAESSIKELFHRVVNAGLFLLLGPLISQFFQRLLAVMIDLHSIGQENTY